MLLTKIVGVEESIFGNCEKNYEIKEIDFQENDNDFTYDLANRLLKRDKGFS